MRKLSGHFFMLHSYFRLCLGVHVLADAGELGAGLELRPAGGGRMKAEG